MFGIDLVPGRDTGDAFHICCDQDFHEVLLYGVKRLAA